MPTYNCAYDEIVNLTEIVPNPENPNTHSKEQVERLAKIIAFQGQRSPIVVSKRSGLITKGHGRLLAIKMLGWSAAAVDYQDYDNKEQEYADMTADNAIAEWATLNLSLVNSKMLDLGPDFDIDLLGVKDFVVCPSEKPEKEEKKNQEFKLQVILDSEEEMCSMRDELRAGGYSVKEV